MNNEVLYKDSIFEFTYEGRHTAIKQNTGYKTCIVGAVLFSDKDGAIKQNKEKLKAFSWELLKYHAQIIFKNVSYTYMDSMYIPDEAQYKNALLNEYSYLLPVNISYSKDQYISYDVIIDTKTFNIANPLNVDMPFDGIAFLALPYKNEITDYSFNSLDKQNLTLSIIEYFDEDKIWILHNQNDKLVFNTEFHFHFDDIEPLYRNDVYKNDMENGLHFVNNGSSNKVMNKTITLGGTTKLFLR